MSRTSIVLGSLLSVFLLSSFVCAQQPDSQSKPLGDVAREQKQVRKGSQKNSESKRVFTSDEVASGKTDSKNAAVSSSTVATDSREADGDNSKTGASPASAESKGQAEKRPTASVLDRPKDATPDVILVPAGTELKVDIDKHKTVVPVRVGFATHIPALSQVAVQVSRTYVGTAYSYNGMPYVDYVEYATVTGVTVGETTYEVQTDSVPLMKGGTNSEVTFILAGPVKVLR